MNAIEVINVSKSFRDIDLLSNTSFNLKQGELACLFGASGSGKSTLLQICAKIIKEDKGKVLIFGKEYKNDKEILKARRELFGFIFQFHHLIPELTVSENIYIPQSLCNKKDINFIDFLLNELGLFEKRNHKSQTLSGGEAQRVAIARAFSSKPKIIFADEPTGSLDFINATKALELILRLAKQFNSTLLFVSHNEAFIPKFNNALFIKKGQIETLIR